MEGSSLASYLASTKTSHAEFARRLGVTDSAVWRWAHGKRRPRLREALAIEKESGGAVPVAVWSGEAGKGKRKRKSSKARHARSVAGARC